MNADRLIFIGAVVASIGVHGVILSGGRTVVASEYEQPPQIVRVSLVEIEPQPVGRMEPPEPDPPPPIPEPVSQPVPAVEPVAAPEPEPPPVEPGERIENEPVGAIVPDSSVAVRPSAAPATEVARDPRRLQEYQQRVRNRIEEHREYPLPARRREQEGTATVRFVIDRRGRIVEGPEIEQTTRFQILNEAALAAVRNAAPFPRFDERVGPETITFLVPIVFSIRY